MPAFLDSLVPNLGVSAHTACILVAMNNFGRVEKRFNDSTLLHSAASPPFFPFATASVQFNLPFICFNISSAVIGVPS